MSYSFKLFLCRIFGHKPFEEYKEKVIWDPIKKGLYRQYQFKCQRCGQYMHWKSKKELPDNCKKLIKG